VPEISDAMLKSMIKSVYDDPGKMVVVDLRDTDSKPFNARKLINMVSKNIHGLKNIKAKKLRKFSELRRKLRDK
jgi:hypothetical protein